MFKIYQIIKILFLIKYGSLLIELYTIMSGSYWAIHCYEPPNIVMNQSPTKFLINNTIIGLNIYIFFINLRRNNKLI